MRDLPQFSDAVAIGFTSSMGADRYGVTEGDGRWRAGLERTENGDGDSA
jgi:hypothetical protein